MVGVMGDIIKSRRKGMITIDPHLIETEPELIREIFMDFIPIQTEQSFMDMKIKYYGISDSFDEVPDSMVTPKYKCIFDRKTLTVTFERE